MNVLPACMYVYHVYLVRRWNHPLLLDSSIVECDTKKGSYLECIYGHLVMYFKPYSPFTSCYLLDFTSFILRKYSEIAYTCDWELSNIVLHSGPVWVVVVRWLSA